MITYNCDYCTRVIPTAELVKCIFQRQDKSQRVKHLCPKCAAKIEKAIMAGAEKALNSKDTEKVVEKSVVETPIEPVEPEVQTEIEVVEEQTKEGLSKTVDKAKEESLKEEEPPKEEVQPSGKRKIWNTPENIKAMNTAVLLGVTCAEVASIKGIPYQSSYQIYRKVKEVHDEGKLKYDEGKFNALLTARWTPADIAYEFDFDADVVAYYIQISRVK